ncbi:MAG TPA: sugar ABC transporter permease [Gaiellaceae bacterium]|jgi:multiple sugar transport system permease protein
MSAVSDAVRTPARSSMRGVKLREALWGYGFAGLPMAVFGIFFLYPLAYAVYISFFHWGILGKDHTHPGAGTFNYAKVIHDPVFHTALKNVAEYTIGVVPLEMALGLSLALLINSKIRGRNFFRSAFYFPSIASSVAITTIALYILNSDGLFNHIIGSSTPWFTTASTVTWAIVGLNAWTTSGTIMLYYLAGLQAISNDVYEAAALDNTSAWRTFRKITLPLLKPTHFFVLVVFGVGALKIFDQAFIVSHGTGGPNYATYTPVLYIYRAAFTSFDFGLAAAAGVVFFVIIFILTIAQRLTVGRPEAA